MREFIAADVFMEIKEKHFKAYLGFLQILDNKYRCIFSNLLLLWG